MIRLKDFRDDGLWSLFEASASGDLPAVKRLVEARPELVNAQYNYTPAIHFAVREGRLEVARYLIERGAEIADYRSYPFQDSLLTIAEDREDRLMADLLRKMAERRFPVAPDFAAFLDAAKRGDRNAVRAALAKDPAMARESDDTGDTALHRAAEIGDLKIMEELIAAGAAERLRYGQAAARIRRRSESAGGRRASRPGAVDGGVSGSTRYGQAAARTRCESEHVA